MSSVWNPDVIANGRGERGVSEIYRPASVMPPADAQREEDLSRCRAVEDALFRRACGYVQPLKKSIKVKRIEYDAETGKKVSEREELETGIEEEHIPADLRVCAYYLNNRDPARWRDDPAGANDCESGVVEIPQTLKPSRPPTDEEAFDGESET